MAHQHTPLLQVRHALPCMEVASVGCPWGRCGMKRERNWETGEGFTNGLSARDIEYLIGVVTDTDYAAYRRGREDAAEAMHDHFNKSCVHWTLDECIAAARGDGEQ